MLKAIRILSTALVLGATTMVNTAFAAGMAHDWQMWFQEPGSPVMERIESFHDVLFVLEVVIVVLVLGIMCYIIFRFNAKSNPVPSKTTHNTTLEVIWTGVPILILIAIAVPSLKLLYYTDRTQDADLTLKVTGNQWFWTYTYPDNGEFTFDSIIVEDADLKPGQPRLLTVDNPVVLPANTNIRILLTSRDVIHNWAVPSLGLKWDAYPGRTNETWVRINAEGDYYGMCSELCGVNHGFMPIHIKAVSMDAFKAWTAKAKKQFAKDENGATLKVAKANTDAR